jgi:hypothetical protein
MTNTQTHARAYILDCIDSEPYDVKTTTEQEKLQFLYDTFQHEMKWNIDRIGQYKAFSEWCQGLPTVFNIEFENYKILELAKTWGTLPKNATEKQEDGILENYWNLITVTTFQLFRKYHIV